MDNRDTNNVNMITTTYKYCIDNPAPLAPIPAVAGILSTINSKMQLINGLDIIATGTSKGVTLDTKVTRANMEKIAFKCASATFAYASSINNNTIKALVNYTIPKLEDFKKEEVDDICQKIHDTANSYFGGASQFGIIASDISDLQTAIDIYRTASQSPRQAIISISDSKTQIKKIIREIIDLYLKGQLDKVVNTLLLTNSSFVNKYFLSREVIDLGTTHTKLRGTVFSNPTDPIANADVILYTAASATIAYQTKSDTDGKFTINLIIPNLDYDLKIMKTGFQDFFEATIHFSPGEEVNRDVVLSPI